MNDRQGDAAIEIVGLQPPPPAGNEPPPPPTRNESPPAEARSFSRQIVLIIYSIFHPKLPMLSVTTASLNAGYVDELTVSGGPSSGLALNDDLSMLVAILSTDKTKVVIELHYMQLDLYFNGHMIGTQVLMPPARERPGERVLQYVHFVTNRFPMPQEDAERWRNATANGGPVVLHLVGLIRAQLRIGMLRRFPLKVYPHYTLWMKPPPHGILLSSHGAGSKPMVE